MHTASSHAARISSLGYYDRMIWLVWSLVAFSILLNLASFVWYLYDLVWWYDKAVHIFTAFAFTLPLPLLLYNRALKGVHQHPVLLVLVVACLGLALGTIWEILEWAASQVWGDPNLREGRLDVITDLIVDGIGSLLGATAGIALLQRSQL